MMIQIIQRFGLGLICVGLMAVSSLLISVADVSAVPMTQPLAEAEEMSQQATEQMEETADKAQKAVEEGMEQASQTAQEAKEELNNRMNSEAEAQEEQDSGGILEQLKSFFTGQ